MNVPAAEPSASPHTLPLTTTGMAFTVTVTVPLEQIEADPVQLMLSSQIWYSNVSVPTKFALGIYEIIPLGNREIVPLLGAIKPAAVILIVILSRSGSESLDNTSIFNT